MSSSALAQLTEGDVRKVITQAASRAEQIAPNSFIAVTDREGYVLGVWSVRGDEPGEFELSAAVGRAGTAAYLSSNANAFTSRTAGFIIQQHFPPGIRNRPPGPLVGVGFSNLPFTDVNRFKRPDLDSVELQPRHPAAGHQSPGTLGSPIAATSLNGIPGGVPLYKNGILVGGVGVAGLLRPRSTTSSAASPSGIEFPPTIFIEGPTQERRYRACPVSMASDRPRRSRRATCSSTASPFRTSEAAPICRAP